MRELKAAHQLKHALVGKPPVAGTAGNKGGRSVFTEQAHSKQIYQRIGSLNVKTVRYSGTLSTLMTVLVITPDTGPGAAGDSQ